MTESLNICSWNLTGTGGAGGLVLQSVLSEKEIDVACFQEAPKPPNMLIVLNEQFNLFYSEIIYESGFSIHLCTAVRKNLNFEITQINDSPSGTLMIVLGRGNKRIVIANIYYAINEGANSERNQNTFANEIMKKVKKHGKIRIIAGDLNSVENNGKDAATRRSPRQQILINALTETYIDTHRYDNPAKTKELWTFKLQGMPNSRIDYILINHKH